MTVSLSPGSRPINRLFKMAVIGGVEAAVTLHIERGDDLEARDDRGYTPLMLAAARNKAGVCRLLIAAGADSQSLDPSGRNALAIARSAGASDAISVLDSIRLGEIQPHIERELGESKNGASKGAKYRDGEITDQSLNHVTKGTDCADTEPEQTKQTAIRNNPSISAHESLPANRAPGATAVPFIIDYDPLPVLDPGRWEPDIAPPAPADDRSLALRQGTTQATITKHAPIDRSTDWLNFDVFLPERATPQNNEKDPDKSSELKRMFLRALREGSVPEECVARASTDIEGAMDETTYDLLTRIINDLGAETDERIGDDYASDSFRREIDPDLDLDDEEALDGATAAVIEYEAHRNDPMRIYLKEVQKVQLLTAEEEIILAKAMDDAASCAIEALATWPAGIEFLLAAIAHARSGERSLASITTRTRDGPDSADGEAVPLAVSWTGEPALEVDLVVGSDGQDDDSIPEADARSDVSDFYAQSDGLSALVGRGSPARCDCARVHSILQALQLKRTFLFELLDVLPVNDSEPATQFLGAIDSLLASRKQMTDANLRLVLSVAKRYQYSDLLIEDLVQEGNIGLLKAVDRFDWRRGFKFSTMAIWWIRQAVTRSIGDHSRTIRLPVHLHEKLQRVLLECKTIAKSKPGEPSAAEIAARVSMTPHAVEVLLRLAEPPLSIHSVNACGDPFYEDIPDPSPDPLEAAAVGELRSILEDVLPSLGAIPERVVRLRFGIWGEDPLTLEEVGKLLNVTRERIRQIESKALGRLGSSRHREILCGWVPREAPPEVRLVDRTNKVEAGDVASLHRARSESYVPPRTKGESPTTCKSKTTQRPSALDRVLAQARLLGLKCEVSRNGESQSICVNTGNAVDAPTRSLVRTLLSLGFRHIPGVGYCK